MALELKLIIEELNKIETKKGKLKYLEGIIFKTKDKKIKEQLIKFLEMIQKNGKRLSFEEIHNGEQKKPTKSLEEVIQHNTEKFDESKIELKDYLNELPSEDALTSPDFVEGELKDKTYIQLETYKQTDKEDYTPKLDSEYERRDALENIDETEEFLSSRGLETEPSVSREKRPFVEATMGEYKSKEIITKSINEMHKKEEEYKRKLEKGII